MGFADTTWTNKSQQALLSGRRDWRISFKSYDWSLNGIHVS